MSSMLSATIQQQKVYTARRKNAKRALRVAVTLCNDADLIPAYIEPLYATSMAGHVLVTLHTSESAQILHEHVMRFGEGDLVADAEIIDGFAHKDVAFTYKRTYVQHCTVLITVYPA